jgi:hypothetical protein
MIHRSPDTLAMNSGRIAMRTSGRFALLQIPLLLGATLALAADPQRPPKADPPPPPAIDAPGVTTPPPADAQNAAPANAAAPANDQDPLAPLPQADTRLVRDRSDRDPDAMRRRMANSEHVVREQDGDTVDEYRQNGKVWMIHIVPQGGGPDATFYDQTGTGRLTRDPRQGPVSPVYFSLYEWN